MSATASQVPVSKKSAAEFVATASDRVLCRRNRDGRPTIRQVKFNILTRFALEADAVAVADDELSQHQIRINRSTADLAVEVLQRLAKFVQHARHSGTDAAQQMMLRNAFFEIERAK